MKQALADPGKAAEAWNDDQWLWRFVRNPDENLAEDRRLEKGVLSQVILGAVARSAEPQSDRLLALRWHEAAERLGWQNKQLPGGPGKPERDRVKQAWSNAQTYWSNYGQRNSASLGGLPGKLAGLPKLAQTSAAPAEALLASYAWLAKQSAAAQLLQAEALSHAGQKLQAEAALNKLLADVDGLKAVDWGPIRTAVGDKNRGSFDETRSDFDVDRGGTAEWTRHAALLRLAALKRPQS